MKRFLLFTMLFVFMGLSAQNLSLNELIALRKMDLDEVESFLTKKGWHYKDGEEPKPGVLGEASFVYSATDNYNYAESFISYFYSPTTTRLSIQIHKQDKYLEYLAGVKKFAPSPINTKMEDGKLVKIYVGNTTTFRFKTSSGDNRYGKTGPVWHLLIAENSDFEYQFGYF